MSNILGFFFKLDLVSHSHMLFHTSVGSAHDNPGRGHLRFGGVGQGTLLELKVNNFIKKCIIRFYLCITVIHMFIIIDIYIIKVQIDLYILNVI